MKNTRKYLLIDRDGTVCVDKCYLSDPKDVELLPNTVPALKQFLANDYKIVFVSNQSGISRGLIKICEFYSVHNTVLSLLKEGGIEVLASYFCPHLPEENCPCRKPNSGLVKHILEQNGGSLSSSIMVGDKISDVQFGKSIGARSFLIKSQYSANDLNRSELKDAKFVNDILDVAKITFC